MTAKFTTSVKNSDKTINPRIIDNYITGCDISFLCIQDNNSPRLYDINSKAKRFLSKIED
jgi:hypothetical protein